MATRETEAAVRLGQFEIMIANVEKSIAELKVDIKDGFSDTNRRISLMDTRYATHEEVDEIRKIATSKNIFTGLASSLVSVLVTLLVQSYFKS